MTASKVGSTYWGKIAQGRIQMLPLWDNGSAFMLERTRKHDLEGNGLPNRA